MKQFTLSLNKNFQRPVVYLEKFFNLYAMLDTGSLFPVWIEEESILRKIGGIKVADNINFGGFGGSATGNLFKIPLFKIGDLLFPNMHIIAARLNMPFQMILSATMFRNLIYEIDTYNHKLNVTIPDTQSNVRNLVIYDKNGIMHVACSDGKLANCT